MASHKKDYYDVLEVSPRARPEVIGAAYKALMKIFHPDKCEDDRVSKQTMKHIKYYLTPSLVRNTTLARMILRELWLEPIESLSRLPRVASERHIRASM